MISLTRIDARLIHGQVAAIWLKFLNADTIIAVSDIVAKDPFMKELYTCAVPDPNIEVLICTTDEAVALYKEGRMERGRVMLIFHDVATANAAYEAGLKYKELDLGQGPSGAGKKKIYITFYVSVEEEKTLQQLKGKGINIYCQGVPEDKKIVF